MKLLVATTNRGKLAEYRELLADIDVEWVDLQDVGLGTMEVAETEDTFAANAILKARAYCEASGLLTLADDSGLVVDALDGAPGVYSARYGAPEVTTDRGRYEKLLAALQDVPLEKRTARFKCVVALAAPDQEIVTVEGKIEGRIAFSPRGSNGFGYDPVFLLSDGRTLAELPSAEKNRISHRGNALEKAQPLLIELIKKINI
ncbi:MAG: RdgB/HAM1 family non-canonical purine NTP pyrophosphatase [Anaerolineae bacterium]|nr:RdgB/HAM1 family non-canonical purine NTP pyrophosphatase [Anaerolineae bacterium]